MLLIALKGEIVMCKTDEIRVRIKPEEKQKAKELFERNGLTISTAVTMFIRQALIADGLPFKSESSVSSVKSGQ